MASLVSLLTLASNPLLAGAKDDPLLTKVLVDQFEARDVNEDTIWALEGQGWIGKDLRKLWFKIDVERIDGETKELELQALYSLAVAPFWDVQIGLRQDIDPTPSRTWAVIGFQGWHRIYSKLIPLYSLEKAGARLCVWKPNMSYYSLSS